MIPVVEQTAREQKTSKSPKGWAMPYDDLYKRLEQLTNGRVLRGDGVTSTEKTNFGGSIFTLDYAESLSGAGRSAVGRTLTAVVSNPKQRNKECCRASR